MKSSSWLPAITGLLFIVAGLRDAFLPGFLSISSHPTSNVVLNLALGMLFLLNAWVVHRRSNKQAEIQTPNSSKF